MKEKMSDKEIKKDTKPEEGAEDVTFEKQERI